jgi:Protein of unknown function (DUF1592)/Protein of unknown function (DUF1588)/Protein of unknown function (DUF1595)/Protein of unknown function (DUF1585)/Protein of unknown function (DUF1587)
VLASLGVACGSSGKDGSGGSSFDAPGAAASSAPGAMAQPGPANGPAPSTDGSAAEAGAIATAFRSREPDAPAIETRIARLTHIQYQRTVQDLFGIADSLDLTFAPDALNGFSFDTSSDFRVDARLGPQYRAMAERLAERAVTDDAIRTSLVSCDVADPACADQFLTAFGERAFRRPLEADELTTFRQLFDLGAELVQSGDAFRDGMRVTIEGFLQSPQFLYQTEASITPDAQGRIALNDWEVASRLSYFLFDSMPDAELFEAARAGQLRTSEQIEAEARRMLTQPRVLAKLVSFHEQAWQFGRFSRISPDLATFPNVPSGFVSRVRASSDAFVQDVIASGGGLEELLTAPYAYVDEGLAPLYGKSATGTGMTRVEFENGERQGLLMQVGYLASNAYSIRTDPIHRGLFVQRYLLCRQIPDPPPGAASTPLPPTDQPIVTTRDEIGLLTGQSYCPTCHSQINPPGFAFEGFDAIGQARDTENGVAVDTAAEMVLDGQLVGFSGPNELIEHLARSEEAHRCYASRWIEFAYGRPLSLDDVPMWSQMADKSLPVADIVATLVKSPQFTSLTPVSAGAAPAEAAP